MSEANSLQLLQICDLAKQWPNLQALHDVAMADLVAMNEDAKAELAKRAMAKTDAEAKAKADAEAAKPKAIPAEAPTVERKE